ncbi:tetratricopeptide repeat protein (macronuclear) [Tetrahymena thermophila SB210]|uniref:Tetratricopeptide repeat protein n=1 Tax=Tetrahymena thermophila (strain SB210) TaxID=312017 RepID=I7M630_TETTS|nr:tetratricopeptide repeat protein [Tetrahymena thermophila SB210]EAR84103.2 tetratricopeptide repeat protein [Tetrahymena thermophila SB210]|eukprot:XP_001031766.2 tetratricopeptide repeat protein [Tetrahymena thermophila SB210]
MNQYNQFDNYQQQNQINKMRESRSIEHQEQKISQQQRQQEENMHNQDMIDTMQNNMGNINQTANFQSQDEQTNKKEVINTNSLKLLVKFIDYLKVKGESDVNTLLLMQERLLYTASYLLERGANIHELHFDFKNETIQFVQKVNLKAMESGNVLGFDELINLLSRAIDMLLYKPIFSRIEPFSKVLDLRILCFNNLSCIYRQNKMYHDALKAVDRAIEMEEILVRENYGESNKNIASTYINKAVIMSELGLHLESIDTIKKALDNMESFRKEWEANLEEQDIFQLKYLSVIAYFNLAVEHEHLFYVQYAKTFYEIALNISRELNYGEMTKTIENVLKKMKKVPQVNKN